MCMLCLCSCCASPVIVVIVILTPPMVFPLPLVLIILVCLGDMCLGDVLGKELGPSTDVGLQNQNCFWVGLVACVHMLQT